MIFNLTLCLFLRILSKLLSQVNSERVATLSNVNISKIQICFFSLMTSTEIKEYEVFMEELAESNNREFDKIRSLVTEKRQVLHYFVKKNLEPKLIQPDWVLQSEFF